MGKRGPQPGFKQARAAKAASAAPAPAPKAAATQPAAASPIPDAPVVPVINGSKGKKPPLSASDRENPNKLSGQALRELAHRRGLAKSSLPAMSDDKIREQLRYKTYNQYESDAVA